MTGNEKYIRQLEQAIVAIAEWLQCAEGISISYIAEQAGDDPSPELTTIQNLLGEAA